MMREITSVKGTCVGKKLGLALQKFNVLTINNKMFKKNKNKNKSDGPKREVIRGMTFI